jgi:hypothetical protein
VLAEKCRAFGKGRDSRDLKDGWERSGKPSSLSHELDEWDEITLILSIEIQANVNADVLKEGINDRDRARKRGRTRLRRPTLPVAATLVMVCGEAVERYLHLP